jgi:ribosome assembly protein 1
MDNSLISSNPDAVQKIVNALSIKVSPRDVKSKDTRNLLTVIMQQWLPLSTATFQAIVDVIPPPSAAQAIRLPYMLHPEKAANSTAPLAPTSPLEQALYSCDQTDDKEVVCYVSKMFAVRRSELPGSKPKELTAEEMRRRGKEERERRAAALAAGQDASRSTVKPLPIVVDDLEKPLEDLSIEPPAEVGAVPEVDLSADVLLGFSRVFSGTLKRNTTMYAALPKYDPGLAPSHPRNVKYVAKVEVRDLYMMMGRELVAVDEVAAGHVCAVAGLDGIVFRNATLWAPGSGKTLEEPEHLINLAGVNMQQAPIVRVALEPENPSMSIFYLSSIDASAGL